MTHLDEARMRAESAVKEFLADKGPGWRVLLIEDVFARLRAILWCPDANRNWEEGHTGLDERLNAAAGVYWSKELLQGSKKTKLPDGPWQNEAWGAADVVEGTEQLRVLERHRAKTGWFEGPLEPPWSLTRDTPPIILFYSFKGGVGRSTALAATALQLAAAGDSVVVIDADLDAPGVGPLLAGQDGVVGQWGLVDYLLEEPILRGITEETARLTLDDYYLRCPSPLVEGPGEIIVFPSGRIEEDRYLDKLARLDYGAPRGSRHPFVTLLETARAELRPNWILIDARAGLGDVSGFLSGGLCHLHVLFGTLAEASWRGLELVLGRMGGERVRRGEPQSACFLVAAMVPRIEEVLYHQLVEQFTDRARDVFSERYYAASGTEPGDSFWTMDDLESRDAPHVPVVLPYDQRLAVFRNLEEVAVTVLQGQEPYIRLTDQVRARLAQPMRSSR